MYFLKNILVGFLLTIAVVVTCRAEPQAIIQYADRFHPQFGRGGMVVSQEQLASRVGADILAAGGNAIDAAVATGFALAVTLPQAGNLGGGGFMLVYLAQEGRSVAIDYRETAPKAAYRDLFLDNNGEVNTQKSRYSALATAVPGTVAGLVYAQAKYGKLPLQKVMAPAIALAENGFAISPAQSWSFSQGQDRLRRQDAAKKYFLDSEGYPLAIGAQWRQLDLAKTLRRIAHSKGSDFYRGKTAQLIAAEMKRQGGLITLEDLNEYQVVERVPVMGSYRGYRVLSMPPPSSGGVHLIEMLNILEGWNLQALGHNSAAYIHRLVESMRRAYADRSKYLGDPAFVDIPLATLIDKNYAASLRQTISVDRATPSTQVAPNINVPLESPQTTHFSTWDADGNVVSNTYTLNFSYGNGLAVSGAGFLLNNEMDDFSSKAGTPNAYGLLGEEANAIAPGKRPLSSMTPTIVLLDHKPILATGSPGGSRIITTILQLVLNKIDFDMNLAEATAAPRVHHQWQPDVLYVEKGISADTLGLLSTMGHRVELSPWSMGRTQSIGDDGDFFVGKSDDRWPGGSAESPAQ